MIVTRLNFDDVLERMLKYRTFALDTETTGLRPYHGDRLFSLVIAVEDANGTIHPCYFNFQARPDIPPEAILTPEHLTRLCNLFSNPDITWYLHNAKFDMHMLGQEGIYLAGTVHCTKAMARLIYNDHIKYDLGSCAERIGHAKDDSVEKHVSENKLWEWASIPGKKQRKKLKFFDRVPWEIISKYACTDGEVTFHLANSQKKAISTPLEGFPNVPTLSQVALNEQRLTKTVYRMERLGILIDKDYCLRAASYENDRGEKAVQAFKRETGRDFSASSLLFQEIFASDKDHWTYTDKSNPSFDSDTLKLFQNPAAKLILDYRDAKSKSDFYNGFLYHADADGRIHPNLNTDGTGSGRLSSSDPNLQNLTDEEGDTGEFLVRRAFIPTPGYCFILPDWDQMEYKLMLEYAALARGAITPLVQMILDGHEVHQATADLCKAHGFDVGRGKAKNGNFAALYGAGDARLAETLKCDLATAQKLRATIDKVAPEIGEWCRSVIATAADREFVFNWLGRRSWFDGRKSRLAYKAPNYLIQGGCADVAKVSMNKIDEYLLTRESRMVLQIHDEFVIEVHESEADEVPRQVHHIMEHVFPHKYLPLTASMEHSFKSMADKTKGYPA